MVKTSKLEPLGTSARDYINEHGQRAVSRAVRRWVSHPASVRHCGEPLGGLLPVTAGPTGASVLRLKQCRNRFVDPYCSGWFRVQLAQDIQAHVSQALSAGHTVAMLVHTASHRLGDRLADVMDLHASTWHYSRAGRRADLWRGVDWIRCWDIIVGGRNGPHPHTNTMAIFPTDRPFSKQWQDKASYAWASAFVKASAMAGHVRSTKRAIDNLHANTLSHGLLPVPVTDDNAERLSAYTARHIGDHLDIGRAGIEVTDDRHRTTRALYGGFTLLELACMAHQGQDAAGRLLAASASDLAGRRSYSTSKGWSGRLVEEDADADAVVADGHVLGLLSAAKWRQHRQDIEAWLDSVRGLDPLAVVSEWRRIDQRLDLCISWLDKPVSVSEFLAGPS